MDASPSTPRRAAADRAQPPGASAELALLLGVGVSVLVTAAIWGLGPRLQAIALIPDAGPSWYEWKLPSPTIWTCALVWGLYLAHQLTLWGLIWWAQTRRPGYGSGLHRVNVIALAANAAFVLLHVAQTHLTCDGLAQDVSIWSSQGAVIVMLVWILLIENPRRGLVFGAKLPMGAELRSFVRRYHGYFFAWAIVCTFWYHPGGGHDRAPEPLLDLRARSHRPGPRHPGRGRAGRGLWPMFAFGFGGLIVMTQMHGLGLSRRIRGGVLALYAALVTWVYAGRGWSQLDEIVRIPVIEILAALLLAGLFALAFAVARRLQGRAMTGNAGAEDYASAPPALRVASFLAVSLIAYAAMVVAFMASDSAIVAFAVSAVGAPIATEIAWRSTRPAPRVGSVAAPADVPRTSMTGVHRASPPMTSPPLRHPSSEWDTRNCGAGDIVPRTPFVRCRPREDPCCEIASST